MPIWVYWDNSKENGHQNLGFEGESRNQKGHKPETVNPSKWVGRIASHIPRNGCRAGSGRQPKSGAYNKKNTLLLGESLAYSRPQIGRLWGM